MNNLTLAVLTIFQLHVIMFKTKDNRFLMQLMCYWTAGNITNDLHPGFGIFHRYMRDDDRWGGLKGESLLATQDKYNYFVHRKGRIDRQELGH